MTRHLVTAIALLALPVAASAQVETLPPPPPDASVIVGPPMLGGRLITGPPITNGSSSLYPVETPVALRFSVGGGSLSAPPQLLVPTGAWGGVNYPRPTYSITAAPAPVPDDRSRSQRTEVAGLSTVSGEASATLVMQFPAAVEIWVNGKKVYGDPLAEWSLTSPVLQMGESHTFEVKSQWMAGGKAFEASRSVTVAGGNRSRSIVVSGTEVK